MNEDEKNHKASEKNSKEDQNQDATVVARQMGELDVTEVNPSDPDKTIVTRHDANELQDTNIVSAPAIPGYQIQGLLGEGGMAKVYLAVDINLNRPVAIKVMSTTLAESADFHKRFVEEGKTIARFRHPNIVTVHASGVVEGDRYIVQEYVPGGDLEEILRDQGLEPKRAFKVAREIASALAYSHEHHIIHRDLKPANILFTDEGAAVLSDFGIARSTTGSTVRTATGVVIGSLRYMAPEQLRGEVVNEKVDIYAFGLVLFEMLTGELPPSDLRNIRDDTQAEEIRTLLPIPSRNLARLIGQCLRMTASERPSAQVCLEQLERQREQASRRVSRKNTTRLATYVAVGLILLVTFAVWYVQRIPYLEVAPKDAVVWVDGKILQEPLRLDGVGKSLIITVAPGYQGEARSIEQPSDASVVVKLAPWAYPDLIEFKLFTDTFGRAASQETLVRRTFTNKVFRKLIDLNLAHINQRQDVIDQERTVLMDLAKAGDAPSKLVLFLAADEGLLPLDMQQAFEYLESASQEGYALATFYLALVNRQAEESARGGTDRLALERYVSLMERAVGQGLDFAQDWAIQAQQALSSEVNSGK